MSGINWLPSDNLYLMPSNHSSHDEYLLIDGIHALNLDQYNCVVNKQSKMLDLTFYSNCVHVTECLDPLVPIDAYHPALIINGDFADTTMLQNAPRTRYLFDQGD